MCGVWLESFDCMVQAWSDKINNLFLLTVSGADTIAPTAGSFATALSGGQNAAITAVVPYPSSPSSYFVQVTVRLALTPSAHEPGIVHLDYPQWDITCHISDCRPDTG